MSRFAWKIPLSQRITFRLVATKQVKPAELSVLLEGRGLILAQAASIGNWEAGETCFARLILTLIRPHLHLAAVR